MDYTALAREYMEVLFKMRKHKGEKKINDSLRGEHFVMTFIAHHGGSVIPSEISNKMGISTARIAAALNGLESKGLVTRSIDKSDRRRILVELTTAGQAHVAEHEKMISNMMVRTLQGIGEEDAIELLRILKKISDRAPEEFFAHEPAIK